MWEVEKIVKSKKIFSDCIPYAKYFTYNIQIYIYIYIKWNAYAQTKKYE